MLHSCQGVLVGIELALWYMFSKLEMALFQGCKCPIRLHLFCKRVFMNVAPCLVLYGFQFD